MITAIIYHSDQFRWHLQLHCCEEPHCKYHPRPWRWICGLSLHLDLSLSVSVSLLSLSDHNIAPDKWNTAFDFNLKEVINISNTNNLKLNLHCIINYHTLHFLGWNSLLIIFKNSMSAREMNPKLKHRHKSVLKLYIKRGSITVFRQTK